MLLAEKRIAEPVMRGRATLVEQKLSYKTRSKTRFSRVLLFLACIITVNIAVQSLLILRTREIKNWEVKIRELESQSIQLRIEMADLESFDRIQKLAQRELGMRVAGPNDYQCIAAVPSFKRDLPQPYGYVSKAPLKPALWAKLATWLGSIGETMAQNP